MFRLLQKPWLGDPEVDVLKCLDDLAALFRTLHDDEDSLGVWADTLADVAETRAASIGITAADYLRALGETGPTLRSESAQMERDFAIARRMEAAAAGNSGKHDAHVFALCALHLGNTQTLRLALLKSEATHEDTARVKILYDTSVDLSERLYAIATAPNPAARAEITTQTRDWIATIW